MIRKKVRREYYEFAVVGGGMSGICAAVAAARHGVKTVLIHDRPVLGGNASSEIRMHICGADENGHKPHLTEGGILHEILLKNKQRNDHFNYSIWDIVLYELVKEEPNLTVHFNTSMIGCEVKDDRITCVTCFGLTTEYHLSITADIFADCTGNGTLGFFAGADFCEGSESIEQFNEPDAPVRANKDRMGNTLLFKAVKCDHPVSFRPPPFAKSLTEEQLRYRTHSAFHAPNTSNAENEDAYIRATTGSTASVDYGYWWIELCGDGDDFVGQYETVKDDLIAYVYGVWDHLKNGGEHGADYYDLEWVGALPGMRESRRLIGDYQLTENDVLQNREFEDAVAYGGWPIDIHCSHGLMDFDQLPSTICSFDGAYTIPWRCYYSKNIRNLVMAGRNISTTRLALGSTRVMGTCAIGGQAVGTAVALMRKYCCLPREIGDHITELQQLLLRDDAFIPSVRNNDPCDIAPRCRITASSYRAGCAPASVINGTARATVLAENAWHSQGIAEGGEWILFEMDAPNDVSCVQLTFDSAFAYPIKITLSDKRRAQQRIGVPPELVKDFTVELLQDGNVVASKVVENNALRCCKIPFDTVRCDSVRIRFYRTNGWKDIRVFETRIY